MKKQEIALIGPGKLGRKCAEMIEADPGMRLAGIVCREGGEAHAGKAAVVSHVSELGHIDAALVCVPVDAVPGVARELLQARIPLVECARLHGEAFLAHKAEIHRAALAHKVPAVVGAGCDPGILSVFRSHFALLAPHGHTETTLHAGHSLHHSLAAEGINGVRKALATELKAGNGSIQRYVYVELEPGADAAEIELAIGEDPLYLGEQTFVFPVASIDGLDEAGRGIVLERHAGSAEDNPASFLLEARFDEAALAARMMLAAARALPTLKSGAWSLLDLPAGALWGELRADAEKEWL